LLPIEAKHRSRFGGTAHRTPHTADSFTVMLLSLYAVLLFCRVPYTECRSPHTAYRIPQTDYPHSSIFKHFS
jgi:hypothetical protein